MTNKQTEINVVFDVVLVCTSQQKTDTDMTADLFSALSRTGVNIDLISLVPSRPNGGGLSFSVFNHDFAKALRTIAQLKKTHALFPVKVSGGYSKITLCGAHFAQEIGIAASFFNALKSVHVEPLLVSATTATISALVRSDQLDHAVSALEKAFPAAKIHYSD